MSKTGLCISALLFTTLSFAQWNSNVSINTPVCVQPGKQNDARIMEDGHGGAFIAWKDQRASNTNPDIYLQRVDSLGYALWTLDGLVICNDTMDQSTANMTTDMNGGVILSWTDKRAGGERDVYAQRITANGNILWATNGKPVANKLMREHNQKLISDGAGGAILVWEQYDTLNFIWDIWAQRIDPNGNSLWTAGGIPICNVSANRLNPKIQKDRKGGAIVVWQDFRNGVDYDVYAQRISATGVLLWGSGGKSICTAAGVQINPKIDPDSASGGAYLAWQDARNGMDYDIYTQRIDSSGNALWTTNGVAVCNAVFNQSAVDIISNKDIDGVILTWKDSRGGNEDIYAQRIASNGSASWTANGKLIATSPFAQINPNICSDGLDGAIITWQDSTVNDWDVYSQKISGSGVLQWPVNGVVVTNSIEIQSHPKNIPDGMGGSIYVWQDKRVIFHDIYCHHIYADGSNVGIEENAALYTLRAFPNPFSEEFSLSFDLNSAQQIKISVNDVQGREIGGLASSSTDFSAGEHVVKMNLPALPSGVYFVRISGGTFSRTVKLVKGI